MKIIFNYKFFIIISLFILLLFTFSVGSFAATTDLVFSDGNTYSLPDFSSYVSGYKHYSIFYGRNENVGIRVILVPYNDDYVYKLVKESSGKYSLKKFTPTGSYSIGYNFYYLTGVNDSFWKSSKVSDDGGFYFNGGFYSGYSTVDIKDGEGNVVFQKPVLVPEITKTLVEQTTQAQITQQLQKMIVGFLKYLMVLVILVIAFWKGWQFLLMQFKKA